MYRMGKGDKCLQIVFQGAKIYFVSLNSLESSLCLHHGFFLLSALRW